jgi:hypothetical protein
MVFGLSTGCVYMHEAEVNSRVYERVILGLRIENQVTWCKGTAVIQRTGGDSYIVSSCFIGTQMDSYLLVENNF